MLSYPNPPRKWFKVACIIILFMISTTSIFPALARGEYQSNAETSTNMLRFDVTASGITSTTTPSFTPTITPSPTATPQLLIAGNDSALRLSANAIPIWDEAEYTCMTFELVPIGKLRDVYITSQGLGRVSFQRLATTAKDIDCGVENKTGTIGYLYIADLSAPENIFLQVAPLSLPDENSKINGFVKIYSDGILPTEIPIEIQQPKYKWWWLFQLVLPLVVGTTGYWLQKKIDSIISERKELIDFRKSHAQVLSEFFKTNYSIIWYRYEGNDREFASALKDQLATRKILDDLPNNQKKKLLNAFESGNRDKIKAQLIKIFLDNKIAIESPRRIINDH